MVMTYADSALAIDIEAARDLNLAMVANGVPLVRRLGLTNRGRDAIRNVTVEVRLDPDYSATWTAHISELVPDGTFGFEAVDLVLDRAALVNQLERGDGVLSVRVLSAACEEIASQSAPVNVLAYNEWSANTVPQILAAFVIPNHPAVGRIQAAARGPLQQATGNPAMDGYQSRSPLRVRAIAQAIYETIQSFGVTYSNPPASFEKAGQKIRTPEQVLEDRMGTCLDLAVLMAACLEQAGLNPLIVVLDGHAVPAVWLAEHELAEGATDDGLRLRKQAELDRLLVFDSSAVATRPVVSFDQAVRVGMAYLDAPEFHYAVDIRGARRQRYQPLPARVVGAFSVTEAVPAPQAVAAGSGRVAGPGALSGSGATKAVKIPRIETWKQRLLDTTLRNRLLNFRETKQALRVLGKDLPGLEDALARGEVLQLLGRPKVFDENDPRAQRLVDERVGADAKETLLRERLDQGALHLDIDEDALWGRATEIYRAARESLEETGTNTLCLALGMLSWYESEASDIRRLAPILLVPVTLRRDARTSQFSLVASGEETRLNATLLEKLRADTGIAVGLTTELPEDEAGVDVSAILTSVREAVVNLRRWEVVNEAHLAHFSFAKFLMWADLEQRSDSLLESPVVAHLVNGKGAAFHDAGAFTEPGELDRRYGPADLLCPLDADASQLAAVAAAGEGKSFVLQGPPGTGKSQSIANLIAHCLAQGKRVLFVAEKVAALDVVQRRLERIGLAPFCLALHSGKTSKQLVLDQLQTALDAAPSAPPHDWDSSLTSLQHDRDQLNVYAQALHADRGGTTVFRALSRLIALRGAPRVDLTDACSAHHEAIAATTTSGAALQTALGALPELDAVAWRGCEIPTWDLGLPPRVRDGIDRAIGHLDAASAGLAQLTVRLGIAPPATLGEADALATAALLLGEAPTRDGELAATEQWPEVERSATALVQAGRAQAEAMQTLSSRYTDGLTTLELETLKARFDRYAGSFFLIAWWMLRGARKAMASVIRGPKPPPAKQVAADLALALTARDNGRAVESLRGRGQSIFGSAWQAMWGDWSAMERAIAWGRGLRASLAHVRRGGTIAATVQAGVTDPAVARIGVDVRAQLEGVTVALRELTGILGWRVDRVAGAPVDDLVWRRNQLEQWRAQIPLLREWFAYQEALRNLRARGAGALADAVDAGRIPAGMVAAAAERSALEAWVGRTAAADPVLRAFHGDPQQATVEAFAGKDRALLRNVQAVVRARLAARVPRGGGEVTGSSELGILYRELKKKARHKPLRKLFREIPELVARLKPCFLMSPLSVAQYLEPGAARFDVVVFDEASQIPTHDAIGALARGRSAVIVGDSKQLPPTSFFQQGEDGKAADEEDFDELESILDECVAARLPERRLDWHYRSRHEDLIAFSNHRYYDNKLNTFPSAAARVPHLGVSLRQIDGVYDKGKARTNRVEAEAVVAELVTRLTDPVQSKRSIGIVTFSMAQQKLVEDLIDQQRLARGDLDRFFDDKLPEPVIIKNLENIQGDERDVMLFSICYGPDQNGKVAMNFGPLNRDGGERRLNVAVTRAREELVVFSTLRPDQIDLKRTDAKGVKDLKTFLDYAQRGPKAIAEMLEVSGDNVFDSPFEEEVHRKLTAKGWEVDTQIGCAGYRIDLGVRHPEHHGRYVLGVECDGAAYHSARSARERDRLRAEVLGTLGWRLHRIWSTDWWVDADREIAKLERAIAAAVTAGTTVAAAPVTTAPVTGAPVAVAPAALVEASPTRRSYGIPLPPMAHAADGPPLLMRAATPARTAVAGPQGGQPYKVMVVTPNLRAPDDIHDPRHEAELRSLVVSIAHVEAPMSIALLVKRLAPFYAITRTSPRITARVQAVLDGRLRQQGPILWGPEQEPSSYQGFRRAAEDARRDAADIAAEEIANAAEFALAGNVSMPFDALVKQAARELGFGRTGGRVAERMGEGIELLLARGRARREGDQIVIVHERGA